MSHAIGLKFTFFRNFWTRCFLPVPRLQKCPQNKFLSLLLKKKEKISPCGSDHMNAVWKITPHQGGWTRPLVCNLCANRVWLPALHAWQRQVNLCPLAVIRMPLESGADGEGWMESDQPWMGVRVPERAGCLPAVHKHSCFLSCLVVVLEPPFSPVNTPWIGSKGSKLLLTICCHANVDAFFKATFLALISCNFVYDTLSFIFTGVGRMEIFLNGSSKETLHEKERPKTAVSDCLEIKALQHFASS